ncbi:MAG: ATP-binding protein [Elusimicrobiota bacterium]
MKTQEIAEANLWWKFGKNFSLYDPHLKKLASKPITFNRVWMDPQPQNIYVVRGPRQVGKTVWIKQTIKELIDKKNVDPKSIFYLSCDNLTGKTRKELGDAIKFFLSNIGMDKKPLYIFLDEISAVDSWNLELKTLADSGVTENCSIIATGSNPWDIKSKKERLPGRDIEGNEKMFFPLSFREFVLQINHIHEWHGNQDTNLIASLRQFYSEIDSMNSADIEKYEEFNNAVRKLLPYQKELYMLFRMYLITGGYPESINSYISNKYFGEKKEEKINNEIYERYVDVLKGDLSRMVKNEDTMRELIGGVLRRQGSRYSFNDVAHEINNSTDHKTVISYTEILRESLLVRMFYAYDLNKNTYKLKADKKIFFFDPFLCYSMNSWLKGKDGYEVSSEMLLDDTITGNMIEGIVGNHISMTKESLPMKEMITFLWLYYDDSREIDYLYKNTNDEFTAIEVKYQNNVTKRDIASLDRIKKYFLISKDTVLFENVAIIPAHLFLFLLQKSNGYI